MKEIKKVISDDQITIVFGSADFGDMDDREVVRYGLLKVACGYYQGSTSTKILEELRLINKNYKITAKGKKYLWDAFAENVITP